MVSAGVVKFPRRGITTFMLPPTLERITPSEPQLDKTSLLSAAIPVLAGSWTGGGSSQAPPSGCAELYSDGSACRPIPLASHSLSVRVLVSCMGHIKARPIAPCNIT